MGLEQLRLSESEISINNCARFIHGPVNIYSADFTGVSASEGDLDALFRPQVYGDEGVQFAVHAD